MPAPERMIFSPSGAAAILVSNQGSGRLQVLTGLPSYPAVEEINLGGLTGTFGNAARNTIFGPPTHQLDMALNKTFAMNDRSIDIRVQATNVFNMPQYRTIDTTVNSPTFGKVLLAGPMRKLQIIARYRF